VIAPAAALALALAASPGCGLPPLAGAPPWTTGETLSFDLDLYGMVRAATLELSVGRPMGISGGRVVPLRARARTDPSVGNLKSLVAIGFSWIDARTLLPEHYREEADEDGVHKVSDVRLTPPGPRIDIDYQVAGKASAGHAPREGAVLDAISAVYYLRAAKLAPGDRICFDLVARGRVWRVEGVVAAKLETLDTAVGKLETLRLDARARLADRPDDPPNEMHVWLSTDSRRLFVASVGEIDAGPVRAMLTGVRGGRGK
jgi:hypothetical protein